MATNFSPCKGSYVLNQFPSNVMFGMNGFHVSASGAIQGHHCPLVSKGLITRPVKSRDCVVKSKEINNQTYFSVFKECFFFNAKRGFTQSDQELGLIMRSLGYSPTPEEVTQYYQKYVRGMFQGRRKRK